MIALATPSTPRLALTTAETAEALGVSLRTIKAMVADNAIPHCHLGKRNLRFPVTELQAWIAAQTRGIVTRGPEQTESSSGNFTIGTAGAAAEDAK